MILGEKGKVMTVTGPVLPATLGLVDAHSHLWIEQVSGAETGSPPLTDREKALAELGLYHRAGGRGALDCQPGGCGRDSRVLADLSTASGVQVVCCSGYHRQRYYGPEAWLWQAGVDELRELFLHELRVATTETDQTPVPVRAGFVKAALEANLSITPARPLEAAALAAAQSGSAWMVHTERGQAVEDFAAQLPGWGVRPGQVILCHIDKRPDFGLHRELAQEGFLLGYDTFYRPYYQPDVNLFPLIGRMVAAGLEDRLALATDMADSSLWRSFRGPDAPGMAGLLEVVMPRLERMGISSSAIPKLLGGNISRCLATFEE